MADGTLTSRAGALGGASMRYHELAIQRWLNTWAFVREGYPVPVVFTSPLDAFSHFAQLWQRDSSPFAYLLELKDADGRPLYEPHPSPIRYPLLSVHRRGWKYRTGQNFSIHRWRHINWPTVSDEGPPIPGKEQIGTGLTRHDLGEVTTARRPMAWDYRFQIDHYCNRPDTQAFFIEQFMQQMWRTGGVPQTWITVPYPGYGDMLVRLFLEGDIENMTPEEPPQQQYVEFRTTLNIVLEGFDVDIRYKIYPALWTVVIGTGGEVDPEQLEVVFTKDVRKGNENPTLDSRPNVPPDPPTTSIHSSEEAVAVSVDAQAVWTAEGVELPWSLDAVGVWNVEDEPVVVEVDAVGVWNVDELGPWTPSLFDVDVRNANGMSSWGPGMGTAGQLWVSHDSPQSTGWFGGQQVGYEVLPNNDLIVASGSSTTPFENYLTCAWHPLTQRMFTRRKNFVTIFMPDGSTDLPELTLGPYAPFVVPFLAGDLSWGLAPSPTHMFCARGQGGAAGTVCKIDPATHTIVAETASVAQIAWAQGGLIYVSDNDRVYVCGSQTGGKIGCIDPATCSITGYLDDSAISGQLYFRLAYCPSTQRLYATTSNQTEIHVFTLTGGVDGVGQWESSISTGSSNMRPIVYDDGFDRMVTAEFTSGVGNGRLMVINPANFNIERNIQSSLIIDAWDLAIPPNGVCYLFQLYPGKIVRFAR